MKKDQQINKPIKIDGSINSIDETKAVVEIDESNLQPLKARVQVAQLRPEFRHLADEFDPRN